jgi:hypothetical protein
LRRFSKAFGDIVFHSAFAEAINKLAILATNGEDIDVHHILQYVLFGNVDIILVPGAIISNHNP